MGSVKRNILFAIALIVIILIIAASYKKQYTATDVKGADNAFVIEKQYVDIIYDADVSSEAISEVQKGIADMPMEVVKGFVDQGWKVSVVKDIERDEDIYPMSAVGETDYDNKTVTVQAEDIPGSVANVFLIRTVHEMSHFADLYYGSLSDTEEWEGIYEKNKGYVEYEYSGVSFIDDYADAAAYASSDRYEMFACGMKDFILHQRYLQQNYPDLYRYFSRVLER